VARALRRAQLERERRPGAVASLARFLRAALLAVVALFLAAAMIGAVVGAVFAIAHGNFGF
jgi:hypothetical protein